MQIKDRKREADGQRQKLVVTFAATAKEVDGCVDSFFKQISQRDIPGFRKGKAPRSVLEQSVGGHEKAMGGVAETLINEYALAAIDDAGIIFIDEPQFDVSKPPQPGKPFKFTATGPVAPSMKLTSYEPVAIQMPPEKATELEIEQRIRDLQDYYHSLEPIDDPKHKAAMGDYVETALTVTNHGRMVSGLGNASRMIGLGQGTMPESFDEQLIGAKVGDSREFDFEAKDEKGESEYGDGDLHAIVEVKGFRALVVPEVDDELAAKMGCVDVADMRKQVERAINEQKDKELPKLMVDRAIEQLVGRLDGEVPEYYVDFIRQDVGRELMQSLEKQGTNLQQWLIENSIHGDQMKEDVSREAASRARIDCALEALFEEKDLKVTEEDVNAMFGGEDGAEGTRADWERAHRMADVYKMCRQSKATRWLVETAVVTEVDDSAE